MRKSDGFPIDLMAWIVAVLPVNYLIRCGTKNLRGFVLIS